MNDGGVVHDLQPQGFPNEQTLLELALLEQNQKEERTLSFRTREELAEIRKLIQLMFMDTHNTNYYVNSYTTKMGVGMADFMKHLRAGIERLQQEISEEEARLASVARRFGEGPKSLGCAKRAAKMLLRKHLLCEVQTRRGFRAGLSHALWSPVLSNSQVLECMDEDGCVAGAGVLAPQHCQHSRSCSRSGC